MNNKSPLNFSLPQDQRDILEDQMQNASGLSSTEMIGKFYEAKTGMKAPVDENGNILPITMQKKGAMNQLGNYNSGNYEDLLAAEGISMGQQGPNEMMGNQSFDPSGMNSSGFGNASEYGNQSMGFSEELVSNMPQANSANPASTVPITTGNMTPQVQNISQGMFGTASNRQRSIEPKPLINI
jgi:hypothetical protein